MADSAPTLNRDSTMDATIKEGNEYLKSVGMEKYITPPEGGDATDADKPQVQRDTTMQATVKDSEAILKDANIDESIRTRGEQQRLQEITEESKQDEPPRVPRDHTMKETAKEGHELLGDAPIGETRSQTRDLAKATEEDEDDEEEDDDDDEEEEEDEGAEDNGAEEVGNEDEEEDIPNLKRTHTMAETVQEGEEFLKRQKTNGDAVEPEVAPEDV